MPQQVRHDKATGICKTMLNAERARSALVRAHSPIAKLLHEALDVGDGACNAVLEIPNAGEGLAVAFEDNAVVQDEDLARV